MKYLLKQICLVFMLMPICVNHSWAEWRTEQIDIEAEFIKVAAYKYQLQMKHADYQRHYSLTLKFLDGRIIEFGELFYQKDHWRIALPEEYLQYVPEGSIPLTDWNVEADSFLPGEVLWVAIRDTQGTGRWVDRFIPSPIFAMDKDCRMVMTMTDIKGVVYELIVIGVEPNTRIDIRSAYPTGHFSEELIMPDRPFLKLSFSPTENQYLSGPVEIEVATDFCRMRDRFYLNLKQG